PKIQERFSLDNHQIRHLITAYGTKHSAVLSLASETPSLAERLHPGLPNIRAEVVYAVREEAALHLSDFLRRRSLIALGPHGRTMELMEEAARLMGEELGWGKEEETFEINAYLEETKP
ncbi:MAG TPA: glycerol-3-phosphate dehydrogenase C-terminal domain-containing protein, partial [Nitrospiria bacterium]